MNKLWYTYFCISNYPILRVRLILKRKTRACFMLLVDSVGQELRQGTGGMACLYSVRAGLSGKTCWRGVLGSWEPWEGITWRRYPCAWAGLAHGLGWVDCCLEHLHMPSPCGSGFLTARQPGSERTPPDRTHPQQGRQRDLQGPAQNEKAGGPLCKK